MHQPRSANRRESLFSTPHLLKLLFICCLGYLAPVSLYAQPANDLCVNAEVLIFSSAGAVVRSGNTSTATTTDAPVDCGAVVENSDVGGVWYTFTGTGANQLYYISTCNSNTGFDTEISVYSGSCGSLVCLGGDDDDDFCNNNGSGTAGGNKSTVKLVTEAAQPYYIYINGDSGASGAYGLVVANWTHLLPANDRCVDAQELVFGAGQSSVGATGSLEYASFVDAPEDCGEDVMNGDSEGIWYTFTGTGANIVYNINTCAGSTNFDTEISVFRGSCGSLECIDGNDFGGVGACGGKANVNIVTETVEPYFIYVKGNNGAGGRVRLEIENRNDLLPANDLCANAIEIASPIISEEEFASGTLDLASAADAPANCNGGDNTDSGGIWYSFTALENNEYIVYTCPRIPGTGDYFDTELSVYKGNCGSLTCVSVTDGLDCGNGLSTTFSASSRIYEPIDTEYFIYLKGKNGATGDFDVRIFNSSPDPQVGYDICNDEPLEINIFPWGGSGSVDGNTQFTTNADAPTSCAPGINNEDSGGLWVEFTGTGNRLYEVTTCAPGTVIDTEVSVYSGNCGSLTCITGNDDDPSCSSGVGATSSTFTFNPSITNPPSTEAERVFFYVKGAANNYGEFTLIVDDISPLNDICSLAESIDVPFGGIASTSGTLLNASDFGAPVDCGTGVDNSDSGGVWYTFIGGNNRIFEISTCSDNTNVDTEISVFASPCTSLTCVDGNDDDGSCTDGGGSTSSSFTFTSAEAVTRYYVYVKGNGGATGTFDITIEDFNPENDLCENNIRLFPNGGSDSVTGTLDIFATTTGAFASCDSEVDNEDFGGIWYTFEGRMDHTYEITTCNAGTDFDTEISVYASTACTSPSLTCVGGNDDSFCFTGGNNTSTFTWTNNLTFNSLNTLIYVKGNAGALGNFVLTVTDLGIVPAEITSFTVRAEAGSNVLEWETATEVDTKWHAIERSADGINWQEIGRVAAAGESADFLQYAFEDKTPLSQAYYRLNTIDFDGSEGRSHIIFIDRNATGKRLDILKVYPVPTQDIINVAFEATSTESLELSIYDLYGRLLQVQKVDPQIGENQVQLDMQQLPVGTYMLLLNGEAGSVTERVVKM